MERRLLWNITVIFFLTILSVPTYAQDELNYEIINYKQDLPTASIRRIIQDQQGISWLACDDGLVRYDGVAFSLYRNNNSHPNLLPSNKIQTLKEGDKCIWVGTANGLCSINKYNRKISQFKNLPFSDSPIFKIETIDNQFLLIGTGNTLHKCRIKNDTIVTKTCHKILTCDAKAMVYKDGILWIGSFNRGLIRYDIKANTYTHLPSMKTKSIYDLCIDRNNKVWVASNGSGLISFSIDDLEHIKYHYHSKTSHPNSISSNTIFSVIEDSKGQIVAGTHKGLSILQDVAQTNGFKNYIFEDQKTGQIFGLINCVYENQNNELQLASLNNGLIKVKKNNPGFEHISFPEIKKTYKSSAIQSLVRTEEDQYIMDINTSNIITYDNSHKTPIINEIFDKEYLKTSTPGLLKYFPQKKLLVCGTNGRGIILMPIDNGKISDIRRKEKYNSRIVGNAIKDCFTGPYNKFWILTQKGLNVMNLKLEIIRSVEKFEAFSARLNFTKGTVDQKKQIWLATSNSGIYRAKILKDKSLDVYNYSLSNLKAQNNDILSILVDNNNRVWAGSRGGGLMCYNEDKDIFENVNQRFGISNDMIFNLIKGFKNDIFMSHENGLIHIHPDDNSCEHYPSATLNNSFNPNSSAGYWSDSSLYFCGTNGLTIIQPDKIQSQINASHITISDIKVMGHSVYDNPDLYQVKNTPFSSIVIPKAKNNIEISFVNPHEMIDSDIAFAYKLEGVDKQWNYVDSKHHFANYNKLSKGKYTFLIKTTKGQEDANEDVVNFGIRVLPALHETWYAYLTYLLLVLALVAFIITQIRRRVLYKQNIKIANFEVSKTKEINQLKLKFFTNLSHELLTPLTIIQCSVEDIEQNKDLKTIERNTQVMSNNVHKLSHLVRQVLEFRKAESDNLRLRTSHGDLLNFIKSICFDNFESLANRRQITLNLTSPQDEIWAYFDTDKIDMIIYNLLSNAFKYNKPNGNITVSLDTLEEDGEQWAELKVADNGIGIPEERLDELFKRFYDGDYRENGTKGTGIGLSLTRDLVALHKGKIDVTSEVNEGTTFKIVFPINKNAYSENEITEQKKPTPIIEESSKDGLSFDVNEDDEKSLIKTQMPQYSVLFVDDDKDLQTIVSQALGRYFNITIANDGLEALDILYKESFDIIVSDVMMPRMDGNEFCQKIKSDIRFCHIPLVILTAKVSDDSRLDTYKYGADSFLEKPFNILMLVSRINNLIETRTMLHQKFKQATDDEEKIKIVTQNDVDSEILEEIMTIVNANIDNAEFSLDNLAEVVGMSKSTLSRKIKSITGMSPMGLLRYQRLKTAKKMLTENQTLQIAEVAYSIGFSDPNYFSSAFRKEFGMTPSELKQKE